MSSVVVNCFRLHLYHYFRFLIVFIHLVIIILLVLFLIILNRRVFRVFISLLKEIGYETSLYLPYRGVVPLDHALHQNVGFNKIYSAQAEENEGKGMDRQALEAMKADISGWMASDQRYVSVLLT